MRCLFVLILVNFFSPFSLGREAHRSVNGGQFFNPLRPGGTYTVHKKPIFLSTPGLQGLKNVNFFRRTSPSATMYITHLLKQCLLYRFWKLVITKATRVVY